MKKTFVTVLLFYIVIVCVQTLPMFATNLLQEMPSYQADSEYGLPDTFVRETRRKLGKGARRRYFHLYGKRASSSMDDDEDSSAWLEHLDDMLRQEEESRWPRE